MGSAIRNPMPAFGFATGGASGHTIEAGNSSYNPLL